MATAKKPKGDIKPVFQTIHYERPKRGCSLAAIRKHFEANMLDGPIEATLSELTLKFATILKPYASLDRDGTEVLDLGSGWKRYSVMVPTKFSSSESQKLLDAVRAMDCLYVLSKRVSSRDSQALAAAIILGCMFMVEQGVRPYEKYIYHGASTLHGAGRPRALTNDEVIKIRMARDIGKSVPAILKAVNHNRKKPVSRDAIYDALKSSVSEN